MVTKRQINILSNIFRILALILFWFTTLQKLTVVILKLGCSASAGLFYSVLLPLHFLQV